MFQFSYDPDRILMNVVQRGFWSLADFRAFEAEFLKRHVAIRRTHRNYRVIAECRDFPVQSAEVGEAFAVLFEKLMDENRGPYAIVVGSTLNKIQAKRALPQPNVRVFTSPDEAMAWVFEGSLPG